MRVVGIDATRALALCADAEGARTTVEIALVEPVAPARCCSSTPAWRLVAPRLRPSQRGPRRSA